MRHASLPSRRQVGALLMVVGLALAGFAARNYFSVAGKVRCDGCEPFHPLFVLAPAVVGAALAVGGGLLVRQR